MTVLIKWHTARKLHTCAYCDGLILPGMRYAAVSLTPRDGDIRNDNWWHQASHGETALACPQPFDGCVCPVPHDHEGECVPWLLDGGGQDTP